MKKLVEINSVCNGSTGKIMCDLAKKSNEKNIETYCFFGRGNAVDGVNCIKIESKLTFLIHAFIARLGFNGHGSYFATKKMVRRIKNINPDIIHLHNIHGYYLNLKVLFKYLKNDYKGKIVWTLHDCWTFTGHCAHFTFVNCNKWKKQCMNCPQLNCYPKSIFDRVEKEYNLKKMLFTGMNNLSIVTPSEWLSKKVKNSFLKNYNIKVINNGIDTDIFKPTYDKDICMKYNIPCDKKIILGVSSVWEEKKGLNVFLEMSKIISDDFIIILIGLNDSQLNGLPKNIIGIKKTDNQRELAVFYTMASVLLNPSVEETFSMVTVEAMACHTPVIVCDKTAPKELIGENDAALSGQNPQDYYLKVLEVIKNKKDYSNYKEYSITRMFQDYYKEY